MIIFIFHFPKVSENEIINVPRGAILFSLEKKDHSVFISEINKRHTNDFD